MTGQQETLIDLIRHGEPEGGPKFRGSQDDPLSELGWQQMRAAVMPEDRWDVIVSSPLLRCRRFAEEMAAQMAVPLHIEQDLREVAFGDWEGLTAGAINRQYGDLLARFWADPVSFTPPGGEPFVEFHRRVTRSFTRWQGQLAGQRVLVVCHGGVIRMILADILSVPLEKSFAGLAVPFACRSRIQVDQSPFGELRSLLRHG